MNRHVVHPGGEAAPPAGICLESSSALTAASPDSAHICRDALTIYERLFSHCSECEPDTGFAERYASGHRCLEARSRAAPFDVPPGVIDAVGRLFDLVENVPGEQVGDWVDRFPRAFLVMIERRQSSTTMGPFGRRFEERIPREPPRPRVPS